MWRKNTKLLHSCTQCRGYLHSSLQTASKQKEAWESKVAAQRFVGFMFHCKKCWRTPATSEAGSFHARGREDS